MRHLLPCLISIALFIAATGCAPSQSSQQKQALSLATEARQQALLLPESPERGQIMDKLDSLLASLSGDTAEETDIIAATTWCELFRPVDMNISYFTDLRDFSGDGNIDGLDVRVILEDRFGDAVKTLGDFRVETFLYVPRSQNPRGPQVNNWFVSVRTAEDLEKYWDQTDRAFRFPLALARGIDAQRAIVQVTYYVPDGSGKMLFAERVIRIDH